MAGRASNALRTAKARLASAADAQIEYLHGIGMHDLSDELALEFDDQFAIHRASPDPQDPADNALQDLDRALDRMSGETTAHLWTVQALRSAPEWREVRTLAARALAALPDA